jgi:hypothetical protein
MRAKSVGWLFAVGIGSLLLSAVGAQADVGGDRPGSILIFPKVVRDGTRDTVIQITNTGNLLDTVHCYYLNGAPGRNGAPVCGEVDFDLVLTRQQPTHWTASTGRRVDSSDVFGGDGAGFDPGLIPPVPVGFTGALVCTEVDANGLQVGQNRLKGEAEVTRGGTSEVSKYNAVAVTTGAGSIIQDTTLSLNDVEYSRCPGALRMSFQPDGALDPVIESYGNGNGQSGVSTNLTLVPCNLDFQNGVRTTGTIGFVVRDEFETPFSGSFPYACWTSFTVGTLSQFRSALLTGGAIQTLFANAELTPTSGGPVVGVAETFHADAAGVTTSASVNLHEEGRGSDAIIRLAE